MTQEIQENPSITSTWGRRLVMHCKIAQRTTRNRPAFSWSNITNINTVNQFVMLRKETSKIWLDNFRAHFRDQLDGRNREQIHKRCTKTKLDWKDTNFGPTTRKKLHNQTRRSVIVAFDPNNISGYRQTGFHQRQSVPFHTFLFLCLTSKNPSTHSKWNEESCAIKMCFVRQFTETMKNAHSKASSKF